ncbi:MAG: family N-acetyltransferase [Alphaproteobacteria bacterium]|nr:family N-acetyltransferase [Alphaproteobacteria bacterium]
MPVEVELFDDLDAVERDAAGALDRGACVSLFDRLAWFRLIERHAPPAGRLLALRASAAGAKAWMLLVLNGNRARAYANWYSLRYSAIGCHGAVGADAIGALAAALRRHRPAIGGIELYPLAASDPLPRTFRAAGWLTFTRPASVSWQIDTEGMDFDAYWATRSSRLRNTAKRKAKAAALDIAIHRRFDAAAWADYERVYQASWKPAEGSAAFLRALAEQEGEAGTLRLGIAKRDGEAIAAQLWLVENEVATIHKLAYAEAARELSPGTVLSVEMFRHALDVDQVRCVDFGTGDDGYKADWMERSEPLLMMQAFNPSTIAGLAAAARAGASTLVRALRSH